jgi:hypothetical protein
MGTGISSNKGTCQGSQSGGEPEAETEATSNGEPTTTVEDEAASAVTADDAVATVRASTVFDSKERRNSLSMTKERDRVDSKWYKVALRRWKFFHPLHGGFEVQLKHDVVSGRREVQVNNEVIVAVKSKLLDDGSLDEHKLHEDVVIWVKIGLSGFNFTYGLKVNQVPIGTYDNTFWKSAKRWTFTDSLEVTTYEFILIFNAEEHSVAAILNDTVITLESSFSDHGTLQTAQLVTDCNEETAVDELTVALIPKEHDSMEMESQFSLNGLVIEPIGKAKWLLDSQ